MLAGFVVRGFIRSTRSSSTARRNGHVTGSCERSSSRSIQVIGRRISPWPARKDVIAGTISPSDDVAFGSDGAPRAVPRIFCIDRPASPPGAPVHLSLTRPSEVFSLTGAESSTFIVLPEGDSGC